MVTVCVADVWVHVSGHPRFHPIDGHFNVSWLFAVVARHPMVDATAADVVTLDRRSHFF
jgi:hypothetical protein